MLSMNAPTLLNYARKGRGKHKKQWLIKTNRAWKFYLATYCWIEVLVGRIQNAHILYKVWKYWHSPMNHCLYITIASAYDIYLEFCEGLLCTFWKVENPVIYQKFREIPSSQMLSYNTVQKLYPGDHKIREVAKVVRTHQSWRVGVVTEKDFTVAKKKWRICKDITTLCFHVEKSGFVKKPLKCVRCGLEILYWF